jgi:mannose-6-phosphate isomerase-like protein (cupin superfamily)
MENAKHSLPFVVRAAEIPLSPAPDNLGLQARPFAFHRLLRHFVPEKGVELTWIHADHGQQVIPRRNAQPSVLIVVEGKAALLGTTARTVQAGDVVTLPASCQYGFTNIATEGLTALQVSFGERSEDLDKEVTTIEQLLGRNAARAQAILQTPYFLLLKDGGLRNGRDRERFCLAIRVFSDAFQSLLFTRQAMCRDKEYWSAFNAHLREELGHNELLPAPENNGAFFDPILTATSSWFCHQMLLLDNVDKAVVNIVLETAGYHFHTLADPVFAMDQSAKYFSLHAEADAQHKDSGVTLLQGEHPQTYRRLARVLDQSWDMLEAMTGRIATLVGRDAS